MRRNEHDEGAWRAVARELARVARRCDTKALDAAWGQLQHGLGDEVPLAHATCDEALVGTVGHFDLVVRRSVSWMGHICATVGLPEPLGLGLEYWHLQPPARDHDDPEPRPRASVQNEARWAAWVDHEHAGEPLRSRLRRPCWLTDDGVSAVPFDASGGREQHLEVVRRAVDLAQHLEAASKDLLHGRGGEGFLAGLLTFAANHPGMKVSRQSLWLRGVVDGVPVRLQAVDTEGGPVTRASAELGEGFPLRLAPQRLRHALGRLFGTITDLSTGDPAFDRAFLVDGMPVDDVRLALSPVAREHLLALVAMGAEVTLAKGKLRATVPGHAPLPEDVMEHVLAAARELSIGKGGSPYRS